MRIGPLVAQLLDWSKGGVGGRTPQTVAFDSRFAPLAALPQYHRAERPTFGRRTAFEVSVAAQESDSWVRSEWSRMRFLGTFGADRAAPVDARWTSGRRLV